jgi:predicted MPP superfamily phosphohydrolase
MTLSILHISDLHRDPANPIGNGVLLSSLIRDRNRYTSGEDPRIPAPNFVIVSGDIVQGVKHGTPDAGAVLDRQYEEAIAFLNALTHEFVKGDKDRVVIVPGNHDVSDEVFRRSLKRIDVDPDARKALVGRLFHQDSPLRWSWDEFGLYEIIDSAIYDRRLAAFCAFYEAFYDGKRSYPINPARQLDVFDCPDFGIAVVGFSSCHNNDVLNRQGAIHPDCMAEAGNRLRRISLSHEPVRIAVWHHNTEGPPAESDYMDPDVVQNLIDSGFSLGLHGHQHRPEFLDTKFRHGPDRRMTVISAGTLCGGAAFRHGRAYNIVEINTAARTGRLHLREMQNTNLQMPIWGPRALPPNRTGFLEFKFEVPPLPFVRPDRSTVLLNQAQALYDGGQFRAAADLLAPLAREEPLARRMLLECLLRLGDGQAITACFDPPESAAEAIALMDALWQERARDRLAAVLELPLIARSTDGAVIEIRDKYARRVRP